MLLVNSLIRHRLRQLTRFLAGSFPIQRFIIRDHSMEPTLKPGDEVLAWRYLRPSVGSVVIGRHRDLLIVKRVERIEDGKFFLLGDNPRRSIDSRRFGPISIHGIVAVVWHKRT